MVIIMKANESVKNYDSKIREYTNYSYRQSKNTCKNFSSRGAGSENEKEVLKHFKNELEVCADSVDVQDFSFKKTTSFTDGLFNLIFIVIATVLTSLSAMDIGSSVVSVIAVIAALLGAVNILSNAVNIKFSSLFAKTESSQNVYAVRKADKEAKKRVVFVANSDSLPLKKFKTSVFAVISVVGFVLSIVVLCLNETLHLFESSDSMKYIPLALLIFIPLAIVPLFADSNNYSQGASKNLSGAFSSIAVLKYLKDNSIEMSNTEICVLILGANEYSHSGAAEFYKTHSSDFSDIKTVFINIDSTAFDEENLGFIPSKGEESVKFIENGAKDAGIEISVSEIAGKYIPAVNEFKNSDVCTITSLPKNYENAPDTHEDMKVKTIESALKTVVSGLFIYDEE